MSGLVGQASQRGFTLVEVLVASLLIGVVLLGEASLLTATLARSREAMQRTQAQLLAGALAERIRANVDAADDGAYLTDPAANPAPAPDCRQPCAPAPLADYQLAGFRHQLQRALPGAVLTVRCTQAACSPNQPMELRLSWPAAMTGHGCPANAACLRLEILP